MSTRSVVGELVELKRILENGSESYSDLLEKVNNLEKRVNMPVITDPVFFKSREEVPKGVYILGGNTDIEVEQTYQVRIEDLSKWEVKETAIYESIERYGDYGDEIKLWDKRNWLDSTPSGNIRIQKAYTALRRDAKKAAEANGYPAAILESVSFNLTARKLSGVSFEIYYNTRGIVSLLERK